ncbi:uroporphyrinogen decarboxylase family protein [Candidatus Poribacteria bacterium]
MKIAFSPSVYEHAAFLIGMTPWDVSHDAELLYRAHRVAYEIYHHSPIVVGIDIYNIEAEAYGCTVERPGGNGVPAVTIGILDSIEEGRFLKPFDPETDGRIGMIIEVANRLKEEFPEADVRVPVSGPFSIAVSLLSLGRLLEDVAFSPEEVSRFLRQLVEAQIGLCQAVIEAGLDVAFFESAAAPPLLSPKHFREVELPALREAMERVAEAVMHPVPCIMGGDTALILDEILSTGTGYIICPAETDQEVFMEKFGHRPDVKVRINLDPNTVAYGSKEAIVTEVDRVLALADGRPNILLGTGAVPYETPSENILFIKEYVG